MAEFFVPVILDQLTKLGAVAFKKIEERVNLVKQVEKEVENLISKLTTIPEKLHDAERRRVKETGVDGWLMRLEDITYEMQDVLDEWNIKIVKPRNLDQGAQVKLLKKVPSLISSFCSCLKEVPVRSEIALKIKGINEKLDLQLKEVNQFNFVTHSAHVDSNTFMTTSIFDELEVHGRHDDKKILFEQLLSESTTSTSKEVEEEGVKVISIVGVGGSGKTTLAQMLYNDDRVQKHFDLRKWVCVSDTFDEKRIAKALLEEVQEKSNKYDLELETLLQNIKITFSGRRFLLVLDDVWTEKDAQWEPFTNSLKNGAPGSIILVTTRKKNVVRLVRTTYTHTLELMSNSECWSILKHKALSGRSQFDQRLETIGRKIAGKCKGLPLAAKVMGSLLRMKDKVEEWQGVLNSEIWQMEVASLNLFPHFYLSYNELPPQLKRCFSYCAVFPKDTEIDVETLIRMWMAQGYLGSQSQTVHDSLNVIGREYFKNLAMCSFFQEFKRSQFDENEIDSCKMHDIVHDFAKFLTKKECRAFDEVDCQRVETTNGGYLPKERVRHLTLLGKAKLMNSSVVVDDIGKVRSLFINSGSEFIPQGLSSSLKSVRSLILSNCGLQKLPPEIGNLIHLRCLDVSRNYSLKELPKTVCDLHFLESLDVSWCDYLQRLPQGIGYLVHLRYLLNNVTPQVKEMPPGLEKLTGLWKLGKFVADGTPSNNLGQLEHLNQLEELRIFVRGHVDFERAQLGKKISMRFLRLDFEAEVLDIESIEMMEPPPNLQQLFFENYPISQLPKWIVGAEFLINNLTTLCVDGGHISSLPALGKLLSLQFLWLVKMPNVKDIGREFYGLPDGDGDFKLVAFPSLRELHMRKLENWERWEDISEKNEKKIKDGTVSIMPRLETLKIHDCYYLEALPNRLLGKSSSLKELRVVGCGIRLKKKYSDKNGADWMKISHIPSVVFEMALMAKAALAFQDGLKDGGRNSETKINKD